MDRPKQKHDKRSGAISPDEGPTTPAKAAAPRRASPPTPSTPDDAHAAVGAAHSLPAAISSSWSASQWRQDMLMGKGLAALALAVLLGWALVGAPHSLGMAHDLQLVARLCSDNALTFVIFMCLGLLPATLVPIMVPAYISSNEVSLAPYLGASFAVGAFSLLLYLMSWRLPYPDPHLPPTSNTAQGKRLPRLLLRATESRWLPLFLLGHTLALGSLLLVANPATWADYWRLFWSSRLVHVMSLDLLIQHVLSVIFVARDSRLRGFHYKAVMRRFESLSGDAAGEQRPRVTPGWKAQLAFCGMALLEVLVVCVPVVGAQVYLLVRPINSSSGSSHSHAAAAAAPAGAEREQYDECMTHALCDRAQGLLHTTSAVARALLARAVDAMHAVFPEGTVVRRNAQRAKHSMRRVLSYVFQGHHLADARVPVRQYSVSKQFRSAGEHAAQQDQAQQLNGAGYSSQEEIEEDVSEEQEEEVVVEQEDDEFVLEHTNVRARASGTPPRGSLPRSLSDAARSLLQGAQAAAHAAAAAASGGQGAPPSSPGPSKPHAAAAAAAAAGGAAASPTSSTLTNRSTRAAKEAAKRGIAALAAAGGHLTHQQGEGTSHRSR